MSRRSTLSALAFLGLLLASGCLGAGPGSSKSTQPTATFSDETGGIDGLVVDDEYRPVGGANLSLVGANRTTTSAADGRFVFSDLAPGQYLAMITARGFLDKQQGFLVPLGDVIKVTVALKPVPPPDPFVDANYRYNGVIRYGYTYQAGGAHGNFSGNSGAIMPDQHRTYQHDIMPVKPGWQTVLVEIEWTATTSAADRMRLDVRLAEKIPGSPGSHSIAYAFTAAAGTNPVRWRLERPAYEDLIANGRPNLFPELDRGIYFNVYLASSPSGTGAGPVLEQHFKVLGSIGYNGPLAPGYTRANAP